MGNYKSRPANYDASKALHIRVMYSGGAPQQEADEYTEHYHNLAAFLVKQPSIADRIQVIGHKDRHSTGRFEVKIDESHETVHSKKAGMGFPKDEDKEILKKIEMALDLFDRVEGALKK